MAVAGDPLSNLIRAGEGVLGAVIQTPQGPRRIRARKGVVLATGGIGWNRDLRARLFPAQIAPFSQAPEGNTGDGISLAVARAGAALEDGCDSAGLWMPCSVLKRRDGSTAVWPHIILDRAKPGLIAVGPDGRRFVNESDSYHDFCMGMIRAGLSEAWLVVDDGFIRRYGLGLVLPGGRGLKRLLRQGYLHSAPSLDDLARRIGIDPAGLARTVAEANGFAQTGTDGAFGRGSSVMNRFNGDPDRPGNPCLGPIRQAPFYALGWCPWIWPEAAACAATATGRCWMARASP